MGQNITENDKQLKTIRDYKVVKANDLIQKSRFSLSAQEQKIILFIISKIKPNDTDLKEQDFSILDFCKLCGLDASGGASYRYIKNTIKGLSDKSMWVTLDNGDETLLRWIERPFLNKNSGIVRLKLDELMKPYLLQLQGKFTQYELIYTLAMKSQYSIRLYELLRSYEWKHTKEFEIEELKKLLIAENYDRFPDFKRKVLDIAMREIGTFSDLNATYEIKKEGRRYAGLIFSISLKKDMNEKILTWKNIDEKLNHERVSTYDKLMAVTAK